MQAGVLWIQEFDVTSVVGDLDAAFLVFLFLLWWSSCPGFVAGAPD